MSAGHGDKDTTGGGQPAGVTHAVPLGPETPSKSRLAHFLEVTGSYREAITIIAAVIAAIASTGGFVLTYFATKQDLDFAKHDLEYKICINKLANQHEALDVVDSQFSGQIEPLEQQIYRLVSSASIIDNIRASYNDLEHRADDLKKSKKDADTKRQGEITGTEKECETLALLKGR